MSRLRAALAALLGRLERGAHPSPSAARVAARRELGYLEDQLARLEADDASMRAMLGASRDSFHHALAAGTTTHEASLGDRRRRLEARIAALRASLEEENAR